MPVKRRIEKARHLEHFRHWQLIEGPDASRQSGVGYLAPFDAPTFDRLEPVQQQEVLRQMRADWAVWGADIMAWWRSGEHLRNVPPWIFPFPGRLPWAAK